MTDETQFLASNMPTVAANGARLVTYQGGHVIEFFFQLPPARPGLPSQAAPAARVFIPDEAFNAVRQMILDHAKSRGEQL